MKIIITNLKFRYIINWFYSVINTLIIINRGWTLCWKNFIQIVNYFIFGIIGIVCYLYLFALFASLVICMVGAAIMGFVLIMKIYSMKNSMGKFTQSKFAYILFKADWMNVHMGAIAKIVAIYFINV